MLQVDKMETRFMKVTFDNHDDCSNFMEYLLNKDIIRKLISKNILMYKMAYLEKSDIYMVVFIYGDISLEGTIDVNKITALIEVVYHKCKINRK